MDKSKKKTLTELGKDVLIVLLACSALWLADRIRTVMPVTEGTDPFRPSEVQHLEHMEQVRPLRLVANGVGGTGSGRCLLYWGEENSEAVFQQASSLLTEALSSPGEAEKASRRHWEEALTKRPGLYFDFQGQIPMEVLTDQHRENLPVVRRLVLYKAINGMELCYRDETEGTYFTQQVAMGNPDHLEELLASLMGDETVYAFESEWSGGMDPDTLLHPTAPTPPEYLASNPAGGGREALEELMGELGFSVSTSSFYASGGEQVARNGNNMLRLSDRGTLRYEADGEGSDHFPIQSPGDLEHPLARYVDTARRITNAVMRGRTEQARLYLNRVEERKDGTLVTFGYSLNGIPVRLKEGPAASFLFRGGHVVQFDLCLRSYTPSGNTSLVLPPRQAAAAQEAMGLEGQELLLVYTDSGSEKVNAGWAADGRSGERK